MYKLFRNSVIRRMLIRPEKARFCRLWRPLLCKCKFSSWVRCWNCPDFSWVSKLLLSDNIINCFNLFQASGAISSIRFSDKSRTSNFLRFLKLEGSSLINWFPLSFKYCSESKPFHAVNGLMEEIRFLESLSVLQDLRYLNASSGRLPPNRL